MIDELDDFKIYPNPSNGNFFINNQKSSILVFHNKIFERQTATAQLFTD
jgi:hypothetical protein